MRRSRGEYAPEADRAFHEALYQNLDNSVLLSLLDVFWLAVSKATERSNVVDPPDPKETVESHRRILEALRERSPEKMHIAFDYHYGRWQFRLPKARRALPPPEIPARLPSYRIAR